MMSRDQYQAGGTARAWWSLRSLDYLSSYYFGFVQPVYLLFQLLHIKLHHKGRTR